MIEDDIIPGNGL